MKWFSFGFSEELHVAPSHKGSPCSRLPRSTLSSPSQVRCDSEGGISSHVLEKGKPEHGVIRSPRPSTDTSDRSPGRRGAPSTR